MTSNFRPAGVLVPLVTPFDSEGRVDLDCLQSLASGVLDAGARGLVALATTGEPSSLDEAERREVLAACGGVCAQRDAVLLVGAGTNDTRTTLARHEALADVPGVSGSLAVVPYYVRPSESAVVGHFQVIAEHSPVPVLIYNIPYRTGRGLGAPALLELADTENIAGVKQAVGGIDADTLTVLAQTSERFALLGGDDAFLYPLVLMGATGAIAASANLFTERFVRMVQCALDGELEQGREHAAALLPLVLELFSEPSPAVIKAVLHAEGKLPTPHVRMPLTDATSTATERALQAAENVRRGQPSSA